VAALARVAHWGEPVNSLATLGAVTITEQDALGWRDFLRDFPGAFKAFGENRVGLLAQQSYIYNQHPELRAQYDALVARSNALGPKLAELKSVYDSVSKFFTSAGGVYSNAVDVTSRAIESAANWIANARRSLGLGDLGIAPIIVAVGVGGALLTLAGVTKWITDAFIFAKRVNTLTDLERKGYTPERAAAIVNDALGKPGDEKPGAIEKTVSQLLWVGGGLVLAWLLLPTIKEFLSKQRRLS